MSASARVAPQAEGLLGDAGGGQGGRDEVGAGAADHAGAAQLDDVNRALTKLR